MRAVGLYKYLPIEVIATASRPETEAWCRELGADEVVDHRAPLKDQLRRIGAGEADYICGPLNAENLREAHARIESGRTIGKLVLSVP